MPTTALSADLRTVPKFAVVFSDRLNVQERNAGGRTHARSLWK